MNQSSGQLEINDLPMDLFDVMESDAVRSLTAETGYGLVNGICASCAGTCSCATCVCAHSSSN
jgi:hypothetical protein